MFSRVIGGVWGVSLLACAPSPLSPAPATGSPATGIPATDSAATSSPAASATAAGAPVASAAFAPMPSATPAPLPAQPPPSIEEALADNAAFGEGARAVAAQKWPQASRLLGAALQKSELRAADLSAWLGARALLGRTHEALHHASEAEKEFALIEQEWPAASQITATLGDPKPGAGGKKRLAIALHALGEARYFVGEKRRREAEAIRLPKPASLEKDAVLSFVKTQGADWLRKRRAAIDAAEAAYVRVTQIEPFPPPFWVIAGAHRVGDLWREYALEFLTMPMPTEFSRDPEISRQYRSALADSTEPMKLRARAAYENCVSMSATFHLTGEHPSACDAGLGWLNTMP